MQECSLLRVLGASCPPFIAAPVSLGRGGFLPRNAILLP
jgi:hypothetical protein